MRMFLRVGVLLTALLLVPIGAGSAQSPSALPWQADLAFLRGKLTAMHPNPFRKVGAGAFNAAADRLNANLASATREQAIAGMMRLVASLGDGHTSVLPGPQMKAGFHVLPLRFYLYADNLVLDAADRAYGDGLGGKLEAINGVPASEVIHSVREVTPGDNPSTVNGRLPSYIVVPEVLAGLAIIPSVSAPVPITVSKEGRTRTLLVRAAPPPQEHAPPGIATAYSADWMDRAPATRPLWLKHAGQPYWLTWLPKERALFAVQQLYERPR